MTVFHVDSEVGRLRQVILHRPGLELSRLTPRNVDALLFDDILWAKRAREEHDAFAQALRDQGVRVHYFADLLAEVLDMAEARTWLLDRIITPGVVEKHVANIFAKLGLPSSDSDNRRVLAVLRHVSS